MVLDILPDLWLRNTALASCFGPPSSPERHGNGCHFALLPFHCGQDEGRERDTHKPIIPTLSLPLKRRSNFFVSLLCSGTDVVGDIP